MIERRFSLDVLLNGVCGGVLMALLSGCTVGPNYQKPPVEVPTQWSEVSENEKAEAAAVDLSRWWTLFGDHELDSLIERAVESNKDLQIAEARIREARAQRGVVAAGEYPTLDASGAYSFSKGSTHSSGAPAAVSSSGASTSGSVEGADVNRGGKVPARPPRSKGGGSSGPSGGSFAGGQDLFQVGFDASWELDIFGGVRRAVEAADADVATSVENRRDVLVTLLGDVAMNYLEVRGSQLRLRIAYDNIKAQEQTLELTQARFAAGLSSELDVQQAMAQLATSQAQVPALETAMRQAIHQLGVLLGQSPEALLEELLKEAPLPMGPPEVPVGLPSDLLRRRPDVRSAERQVAAATARIGVATADLFPKFSLTGSLGQQSMNLGDIALGGSTFWSIGPTVSWPIFEGGRIRANIQVQDARQEQTLIQYQKTVLTALQDVENSLVAYSNEQATRRALRQSVEANQHAFDIASELYSKGLVDFLNVLVSQRSLQLSQDQLAQSDQRVVTNLVSLFKALGGGWQVPE